MIWHYSTALQSELTYMQIVKTGSLLAFFVWSQILLMAWPFSHDQSHSHGHTFRMTMSANRGAEAASSPGFLKVVAQEMMDLFEGNGVQLRSHPGYAWVPFSTSLLDTNNVLNAFLAGSLSDAMNGKPLDFVEMLKGTAPCRNYDGLVV